MATIYQLVGFVNGFNKKTKQWESLYTITKVYIGKKGLKTAYKDFETFKKEVENGLNIVGIKYSDVRGKVEIQKPRTLKNGTLAYWQRIFYSILTL